MGMHDTIIMDPAYGIGDLQTKDLSCNMSTYRIIGDRLWRMTDGYGPNLGSVPLAAPVLQKNMEDGIIRGIDSDLRDFALMFVNDRLDGINLVYVCDE